MILQDAVTILWEWEKKKNFEGWSLPGGNGCLVREQPPEVRWCLGFPDVH